MKLELENGTSIRNPDTRAIAEALASLDGFAILGRDEMTYMQTSGSRREGFVLEYQEGDTDRHYQCPDPLTEKQITEAFLSYADGTDAWKTVFRWEKMDI